MCDERPKLRVWTMRLREPTWAQRKDAQTVDMLALGVLDPGALPDATVDYSG